LLVAMAMLTVVASIPIPAYQDGLEDSQVAEARVEVRGIEMKIERCFQVNGLFPEPLAEVGMEDTLDPWGNPCRYLRLQAPPPASTERAAAQAAAAADRVAQEGAPEAAAGGGGVAGQARKDRNVVPVNTDFDLYCSKGPDGRSAPPLTAAMSRDDIVRASNGRYIGEAEGY
jgi:general secretion pathway protein G